ncbi:MAG: dihydrolipoamide acetyltransferase family protein [Armatimonadota bacterium]|nr:dihydrolipoamide acetyltransferase family protein [Armatimonadota bacterium]MDR7451414.1 dihydrolipoamide acetyltransferase family protein [Armatimonadota bacterium]MDR7466436.1 dihydrolipoamide acetyltransferase family protein [Armatimonadota bacterium]MDR7493158.1 dihydrolipoamide acetyltransferase family protein [Armatimonadota bacterium]MDR7500347.1 dihydrolipoamide acetyltransferase family protein [Armatimonadota bacterium]
MGDVIMPKMGDAMTEGRVLRWRKRPGDPVRAGEAIAEIETDKVNVDLEAEESGTLLEIVVPEGQSAPVGARIAVIGAPGAQPTPAGAPPTAPAPRPAPAPPTGPLQAEPRAPRTRVKASPLARRLAEEHGLDLSRLQGTGPDGRITKEDVEAHLALGPRAPAAAEEGGPDYTEETPGRMRATIARRMAESKLQAPHFYVTVQVVMDDALRARQQLNRDLKEERRVTVNDFVIRAAALALRAFPNLNSAFVNGKIRRFRRINIAVAVALPDGLIAPVLRDCDRKSLLQISEEARALTERTRSGHLRPDDYEGGTFTISNLGMFDFVENFVAIINPPHAAILAVGAAQPRAVVRGGQLGVATTMALTLSADHRVTDGAEAARFLGEIKRLLENPFLLFVDAPQA